METARTMRKERTLKRLRELDKALTFIQTYKCPEENLGKRLTITEEGIRYYTDNKGKIDTIFGSECKEIYPLYDNELIREVMDEQGEFSITVIYDKNNRIKYRFVYGAFIRVGHNMAHTGSETDNFIILTPNPFNPYHYIFTPEHELVEAYDHLNNRIIGDEFEEIKRTVKISDFL